MRKIRQCSLWLVISILGMLTVSPVLLAQAAPGAKNDIPVLTDWSYHHVIFSKPATTEQASRVEKDPRYWQQLYRRQLAAGPPTNDRDRPALDWRLSPAVSGTGMSHDWQEDLGIGASIGAGNYGAKFSFHGTSANCGGAPQPDFVVFSTGLQGSTGQASIVAYDNLYSGCGGTVPSVYWAYNTGGQILTSPAFSRDGKQVAFVETNGGFGILVILKWAASTTETISHPDTLVPVSNAAYRGCTAPCMTTVDLKSGLGTQTDDTTSSVFPDLSADTGWVGGAGGWLHKITGMFLGTPTEVTGGPFPVQVNPGNPNVLSGPVHDSASGTVFVGDAGGNLYSVDSSTAAVTQSGQLDFGVGIVQSPIVDPTRGFVYVFASSDGSGSCTGGTTDCTAVYQLSTNFIAGDTGSEVVVGNSTVSGTNPNPMYIGAFDSTYQNSANATGNLYVCGNTGGSPTLYQVFIDAGAFTTTTSGPVLSSSNTPCSPVTDILNPNVTGGATEWVFASAQTGGVSSGCSSGGCIFNFKDTPWNPSTAYTVGQEILDSHFQIQVVTVAGTSGASVPGWSTIVGHSTTDGTVHWVDQGVQSASTPAAWTRLHAYSKGNKILDPHNYIQLVTTAGTSGGTIPTFNQTAGGTTTDGTVKWTNIGAIGTAALAAAGGTSGIIIDNTVGSGTLPGASQIYFSTLSDQVCGTSGTGGCAVQAAQSNLQ
jgi:hypothetical protein